MKPKILEIIPINHEYEDAENSVLRHFTRLRNLYIKERLQVDDIYYIIFQEEKDKKIIEILKGALKMIYERKPKDFIVSLNYPEIIRNIRRFRQILELEYSNWHVFLNLTSLKHHLHSFLLRDGLKSKNYELFPYEIYDFHYESSSNYVIIPDYRELELVDYEIMEMFIDKKNEPLSLKIFINNLETPGWDKSISTFDQKLRKRLNLLVNRGLLDYKVGANGEKFYKLKFFNLDYFSIRENE